MDSSLPTIHQFTLAEEEGPQTAPLDGDPGGATNWGITVKTLNDWLGRPATAEEVYALTFDEASKILDAWYYRGMGGRAMPAGIDLMLTDHAFNCGVADAKTLVLGIQSLLAVEADGIAGHLTTEAAGGAASLLAILRDHMEDDYRSKSDFATFGAEWIGAPDADTQWKRAGRLGRRYAAALKLAGCPPE